MKKNTLTKFEQSLLESAFLVMERDMNYDQEDKILQKTNASVTDLYELARKLESIFKIAPTV